MIERLLRIRDSGWAKRYPPPEAPWTEAYVERHRALVREALEDRELVARIESRRHLPRGYGFGYDERVVEYPWLGAQRPSGHTLDAGSTLNHAHVLDYFLPRLGPLHIVTLAPEALSFPERGVSYLSADLRDLPYRDGLFETVVCLSTLEHVGMDNTIYGSGDSRAPDPDAELARAVAELRRVLRPHGLLLITVPYGRAEDHGWFRQLDRGGVERLVELVGPRRHSLSVFRYDKAGWQLSDLEHAADARYRDYTRDPAPADDRAAAARAVVCLRLEL